MPFRPIDLKRFSTIWAQIYWINHLRSNQIEIKRSCSEEMCLQAGWTSFEAKLSLNQFEHLLVNSVVVSAKAIRSNSVHGIRWQFSRSTSITISLMFRCDSSYNGNRFILSQPIKQRDCCLAHYNRTQKQTEQLQTANATHDSIQIDPISLNQIVHTHKYSGTENAHSKSFKTNAIWVKWARHFLHGDVCLGVKQ